MSIIMTDPEKEGCSVNKVSAGNPIEICKDNGEKIRVHIHDFDSNVGVKASNNITMNEILDYLRKTKCSLADRVKSIWNKIKDEKAKSGDDK